MLDSAFCLTARESYNADCHFLIVIFFSLQESEYNYNKGMTFLMTAANHQDRESMLLVANAFHSGQRLGSR